MDDVLYVLVYRMENFITRLSHLLPTVGTLLYSKHYPICHRFVGAVPASATAYVNCFLTMSAYRYVIIEGGFDAMCLLNVQVFVAGR
jgi:hypothetical protein